MRTVTINKRELIAALTENRKKHKADYDAAAKGYRDYMATELAKVIIRLNGGENVELRFDYDKPPQDHTGDYDVALKMLSMSVDDMVDLTELEFRQLVLDDWDWQKMWKICNTKYLER